jgi:hypothetical protein
MRSAILPLSVLLAATLATPVYGKGGGKNGGKSTTSGQNNKSGSSNNSGSSKGSTSRQIFAPLFLTEAFLTQKIH